MDEVKNKRGKIGFGEEKILLEENYLDYFRNLYRELWKEGEHHHMLTLFLIVFAFSYSATIFAAILFYLGIRQLVIFIGTVLVVFGVIWTVQRLRGFTTDLKIDYSDINTIRFVKGRNLITCPRFVIKYGEEGKQKRRYISMHSHMIPGVEDRIDRIKENFESRDIEVS
jgi:hypothetical protein